MNYLVSGAAFVAFVSLLGGLSLRHASANEPHEGLNFSIGVRGAAGCNTRASDVSCTFPAGRTFVVEVSLDELPDDIPAYGGFDLYAEYAGVAPTEPLDANNHDWGDCGFPAAFAGDGFVGWGCAIGPPPAGPSSWIGAIGAVTFTCTTSGSISLVHGAGFRTDLIEMVTENETGELESVIHSEGGNTREALHIACGTVPASTPGTGAPVSTPKNTASIATSTATPPPALPSTGQQPGSPAQGPFALFAPGLGVGVWLFACAAVLRGLAKRRRTVGQG